MRFTPDYNVMYHGTFYHGNEPFEIDENDVEEMKKHGEIEGSAYAFEETALEEPERSGEKETELENVKQTQRRRPKKSD